MKVVDGPANGGKGASIAGMGMSRCCLSTGVPKLSPLYSRRGLMLFICGKPFLGAGKVRVGGLV